MTFQSAEIELQSGMGGPSLVIKNSEGYAVVIDDVDDADIETITDIFGDEVTA